jgi:hypothetical protein
MKFPCRLYHKDEHVHRASGYPMYPIVVQSEEEFNGLAPGWCEDPVDAANFGTEKEKAEEERDDVDVMLEEEIKNENDSDDEPKKKSSTKKKKK